MEDFQQKYDMVISLVRKGDTIEKATESTGMSRVYFYKLMSKEQKEKLKREKVAMSKLGNSGKKYMNNYVEVDREQFVETDDNEEIF